MPFYINTTEASLARAGATINAVAHDLGVHAGSGVPVKIRLISNETVCVDDEPRRIIRSIGKNGRTTFLVEGATGSLRNAERRIALARVEALLAQLATAIRPLLAGSEAPGLAVEALGLAYNWLQAEKEHMTAARRSDDDGAHDA